MTSILHRRISFVVFVIFAAGLPGCNLSAPPLPNSAGSPEELARAVLTALEQRDLPRLRALALNEQEFREQVWPDLPSARPERNLPVSFVWGDLHQKSEAALSVALRAHGGRHYSLVDVTFQDGVTQYKSYLVHRRSVIRARDEVGQEQRLQVFGSMLAKAGRYKVFSYVVD